jgi:hypothetical protein
MSFFARRSERHQLGKTKKNKRRDDKLYRGDSEIELRHAMMRWEMSQTLAQVSRIAEWARGLWEASSPSLSLLGGFLDIDGFTHPFNRVEKTVVS